MSGFAQHAALAATTVYDAPGWDALFARPLWLTILGIATLLAVGAACFFGWSERRVARRGAAVLLAFRLAAIGAAVGLVIGFERRTLTEREEPSRVVLLIDESASMTLPAGVEASASSSRSAVIAPFVDRLAESLADRHRVRAARFDVAVDYKSTGDAGRNGGSTRLGEAIRRVVSDHATTPLAAIFIASDGGWNSGADPLEAVGQAVARPVPIHTLGVGPLREPPSVGLRDLAAPSRAATGDAFRARVTIAANRAASLGGAPHRIRLTLRPVGDDGQTGEITTETEIDLEATTDNESAEGGVVSESVEIEGLSAGTYELAAVLTPSGRDADPTDNELTTPIEFVDEPTRVLLAAGGPSRDYRFLRDSLFRDELFSCDVLLQTATGAVTQDAGRVLDGLPATVEEWEVYDALVAIDLDWRPIDVATQQAVADWVSTRGGGLVYLAGPVSTPSVVRAGLEPPLRTLLPVTLRDDPLGFGTATGRDASPVRLMSAGSAHDWLALDPEGSDATATWRQLEGFYSATLPAEPKPGATVLATLGEGADARPLFVEQLYGAGRVVYGASAETWRLRRVDPASFTALHVGLLRHVTQGRLLGADTAGGLLFDREQYDLGETMTVRFLARDTTTSPPNAVVVRLAPDGQPPVELRLPPVDGQTGVFAATVQAESVGRHTATLSTGSGERLTASAEVSLPELENETRVQNVALLREIAERSGGRYFDLADANAPDALRQVADETASLTETTVELGPPDERFAETLSRVSLGVMAGALLLEWLLRRTWRLA